MLPKTFIKNIKILAALRVFYVHMFGTSHKEYNFNLASYYSNISFELSLILTPK